MKVNGGQSPAGNSTFAIGGVSRSADSLVVAESLVNEMNFCGEKPAHRKPLNHYLIWYKDTHDKKLTN